MPPFAARLVFVSDSESEAIQSLNHHIMCNSYGKWLTLTVTVVLGSHLSTSDSNATVTFLARMDAGRHGYSPLTACGSSQVPIATNKSWDGPRYLQGPLNCRETSLPV